MVDGVRLAHNSFLPYTLAASPNSEQLAVGGEVLNPKDWPFAMPIPKFGSPAFPDTTLIAVFDMPIRSIIRTIQSNAEINKASRLVWSPNGKQITNAGGKGLQIFDAQSGNRTSNVDPTTGLAFTSLRYSPNTKYLFEGLHNDQKVGWGGIWDGQHTKLLQQISENVASIAVSKDRRYLATGVNHKTII